MADDSDAVVAARIDLLDYLRQRGLLFPGMDERNHEPHALIDALIAAVRAEQTLAVGYARLYSSGDIHSVWIGADADKAMAGIPGTMIIPVAVVKR